MANGDPVCGVYLLFRKKELVYIGRSGDCAKRIKAHASNGRPFDDAYFMAVPEDGAGWVEAALIRALASQNKMLKPKIIQQPPTIVKGPTVYKDGKVIYKPVEVTYDPNEIYTIPAIRDELRGYQAQNFIDAMKSGAIPATCSLYRGKNHWRCRAEEVFRWKRRLQNQWAKAA